MTTFRVGDQVLHQGEALSVLAIHFRDGLLSLGRDGQVLAVAPWDSVNYLGPPVGRGPEYKSTGAMKREMQITAATKGEMKVANYENMTGAELLKEYNKVSLTKRKAKFPNAQAAIKAIEAALKEKSSKPAKAAKKEGVEPTGRKAKAIKILVKGNPHKEGTKGYGHFEGYSKAKTYGEFIDNAEDPKKAREWFAHDVRKGYVELTG